MWSAPPASSLLYLMFVYSRPTYQDNDDDEADHDDDEEEDDDDDDTVDDDHTDQDPILDGCVLTINLSR